MLKINDKLCILDLELKIKATFIFEGVVYWAVKLTTNISTAFHILSISIRRLRSVLNPYKVFDTSKILTVVFILFLWIFSAITASIPFLVINQSLTF